MTSSAAWKGCRTETSFPAASPYLTANAASETSRDRTSADTRHAGSAPSH
jgi:hypothetical protein